MAEDIKENYDLSNDDVELIGMARGGLPMLVTLSHMLGIRQISIIQTQMSNSDNCHDYGKFRYMSDNISKDKTRCILLEDIILFKSIFFYTIYYHIYIFISTSFKMMSTVGSMKRSEN